MRAFVVSVAVLLLTTVAAVVPAASAAPGPGYRTTLLYFSVHTGPNRATPCTIVGELRVPNAATARNRAPAMLTTNGFGGSYKTQEPTAKYLASQGYVTLAYSGLGFGGSSCKITLDSPGNDGVAASQLISYLGGARGIAFTDKALRRPAPVLDSVRRDRVAHDGRPHANDPRVGMIGGSYGGGIQFAAASVDPRIDTIVPLITWNDLSYSLAPNSTSAFSGVSSRVPGASKTSYTTDLFETGVKNPGRAGYASDPARAVGCPNFVAFQCAAITEGTLTGQLSQASVNSFRATSVTSYVDRIKVPVLLGQGQQDTLFDLNEGLATYRALRARGVETKMIWHYWGHSGEPAPGEYSDDAPDRTTQYETGRILDWLDHYLKDSGADTGPRFAYFRNWIDYRGNARPAYAAADEVPRGAPTTFGLSAGGRLVSAPARAVPGATTIATAFTGRSGSASWTTGALSSPLDVVGIPTMTLRVRAIGQPVVFAQIYDVAPNGAATSINDLVAPVRIANPAAPVRITFPGLVHRFAAGHSLQVRITGSDPGFRGGLLGQPVTLLSGPGQSLAVPVVD
ncbi:alpha/beta fold hydrolase [Williamsia phyllosphaerae]|uniref:Xaa-Pro dipeptidyl-peptidase C-terminal domain-containing protein n=1 Tax=Williamsia phyllosphaerae TaxID=885042 RepID=A0ABQ1UH21_9NOCA|nr:alpha/beta fold hydrolase [Williamsia phyllosphaerae]GGF17941.1 hypothetical protein GCM10007298_12470 [Williamsia phyllosphaerae]